MGFTPSGGGEINIDIEANDNASKDIESVQDKLDELRNSALATGSVFANLGGKIEDAADEMSDILSSATEASGAFQMLQGRADEAGEEIDDVGDESAQASAKLGLLAGSSQSTAGAMAALATVSTVSLVPSLVALSTVAVPLVGTLGALAAGFAGVAGGMGAVIGSGMFAYGKKLSKQNKEQLEQVNNKIKGLQTLKQETGSLTKAQQKQLKSLKKQKKELSEATTVMGALSREMKPVKEQLAETGMELGKQFIPLIRDAIDALPAFIRQIQDAIGPLQPFADALRELGQTAFRVIPNIVEQIMDMGREALPEFVKGAKFIMKNTVPALKAMGRTADRVIPLFKGIGSAIVELLPVINEFGLMLLEEIVPRMRFVINKFIELNEATNGWLLKGILLVSAVSSVISILGTLGTAISGAISAITAIVGVLGGPLTLAIAGIVAAIGGLAYAWSNNMFNIRDKTRRVVNGIKQFFSAFEDDFKSLRQTAGKAVDKIVSSFSVLSDEATAMWNTIKKAFTLTESQTNALQKNISENIALIEGAIQSFADMVNWLVKNHYQPMMKRILKLTKTHLGPTVDEFIETYNVIMDRLQKFINVFVTLWNRYGDEIMAVIKPILKGLRILFAGTFDTIFTLIRVILNLIQGDWQEAWSAIEAYLGRSLGRLEELLGVFKNAFTAAWDLIATVLSDAWDALWTGIENALTNAFNSMVNFITGIGINDIRNAFKAVGSAIRTVFIGLFNAIVGAGGLLKGFFTDIYNFVTGSGKSQTRNAFNALMGMVEGVWNDMVNAVIGAGGIVKSMITDIANYLRNGAWEDLKGAAEFMVDAIYAAFEGLYKGLIGNSLVKEMFQDIDDYIRTTAKNFLGNAAGIAADAIEGAFDGIAGAVGDAVHTAMENAKSWISGAIDDIISSVEDMFNITIDGPDINWPEPPQIVQKAYNGNLNIDWPDPPSYVSDPDTNPFDSDNDDIGGNDDDGGIVNVPNVNINPDTDPFSPGNQDIGGNGDDDDSSNNGGITQHQRDLLRGSGPTLDNDSGGSSGGFNPDLNPFDSDNDDLFGDSDGLFGFANGGIVTDTVMGLIGETGKNEAVVPLDRLSSMLETSYHAGATGAGAGGGGEMTVRLKVEGDDELSRLIKENAEVVVEENDEEKRDRLKRFK